jgi:membrane protease YdiL (CAAX protease family)
MLFRLRQNLRYFIPIWMFPVVAIVGLDFHPPNISIFLLGIFLLCSAIAPIPYYTKRLDWKHVTLFGAVFPFIIWIVCVVINAGVLTLQKVNVTGQP